jgi:hypothetical protein
MARIFYLHWNEAELLARVAPLEAAGHEVKGHWSTEAPAKLGDFVPDAVVVSLDRLPSHGRAVAEWFWEAKKRQSIPLLFAGGQPDKVAAAQKQFPRARFVSSETVLQTLDKVLG